MQTEQPNAVQATAGTIPAPSIAGRLRFGIRQKIIAVLITVLTLAMGLTGWLMIQQSRENIEGAAMQRRAFFTRFVAQSLVYNVVGHDYHTLQMLLGEMTKMPEMSYAKVLSAKRNVMAESGRWPMGETDLLMTQPIMFDGRQVGELSIAFNTSIVTRQVEAQKRRLIISEIVVMLLIAAGEFAALSFLIIRPIRLIGRALDTGIDAEGRIVRDVPVVGRDELGRLAAQLNLMRAHLNEANAKLRSRAEAADAQLRATNETLRLQSHQLKRVNEDLRRLSVTDALTGLYNRRHMEATIEAEIAVARRHGHPFSLIVIDIDYFKRVNDTYGHGAGDLALCHVAALLQGELRQGDIVGRVGGEEFLVLCRHLDATHAMQLAEKIRSSIEATPLLFQDQEIRLSASLGVTTATAPRPGASIDEYMHAADRALYYSKHQGRNRITHADDLGRDAGESR